MKAKFKGKYIMAFTNKLHGSTLPQTNFATRKLAFLSVAFSGADTDYADVGSDFQLAVQGIQQVAEIYALGTPASGAFVVVVSEDTVTSEDGATAASMIDAAVSAATGASVTVTAKSLTGATLA